jgi:5-methylcytosine-specific restriction endonuclease McrA
MKSYKERLFALSVDQLNYLKIEFIRYDSYFEKLETEIKNEINSFRIKCHDLSKKLVELAKCQANEKQKLSFFKPSFFENISGKSIEYCENYISIKRVLNVATENYVFPKDKKEKLAYFYDDINKKYAIDNKTYKKSNLAGKVIVDNLNIIQNQMLQLRDEIIKAESDLYDKMSELKKKRNNTPIVLEDRNGESKFYLAYLTRAYIENAIVKMERKEENQAKIASYDKKTRNISTSLKRKLKNQLKIYPNCPYCHKELEIDSAHADHIYPVTKGGQSVSKNMVFVCSICNLAKGRMTLRNFLTKHNLNEAATHIILEKLGKDF